MTNDELLGVFLPKWPQMIVTGDSVTKAQASEIIRRTDCFFTYWGGNNHKFIEEAKRILYNFNYSARLNDFVSCA